MFTGIVEAVGSVERKKPEGDTVTLTVRTALDPGELGASLAVDGTCLTVTEKREGLLTAVIGPETLRRTTLGDLREGDGVNLERPLRLQDRLGGHLVQGHVDAVGTIERRIAIGPALEVWVAAPPELLRYVVVKGSIAVDGVSLTVNRATETAFEITLIPHTLEATTLGKKGEGARVNLEVDLIAKYVERLLSGHVSGIASGKGLTLDFLKEHGYAE